VQTAFPNHPLLSAEGKQESDAYNFLKQARSAAMELHMLVEVHGVVPAAMPKRANHYRAQLLVEADKRKALGEFLRARKPMLDTLPAGKLRWVLDVDPMEF
jgi:primosomal protein N' (replication factor Y)